MTKLVSKFMGWLEQRYSEQSPTECMMLSLS